MSSKQHPVSNWLSLPKYVIFVTYLTLPSIFICFQFLNMNPQQTLAASALLFCFVVVFLFYQPASLSLSLSLSPPFLLHHLDPEGDAAQELVPFVVVAQVGALHPALHRQLLVVVLLGEQQLHGHQRLHVILLQSGWGGDSQ